MSRKILHVDLDAFYCSVEEILDPRLRGKPFVVGGSPEGRGVVSSASYPARQYGIRSAMPTAQALRLYPDLIVLSGRHEEYGKRSKQVMDLLRNSAPRVQSISIDEAFLDVSDDPRQGEEIARDLQLRIQHDFELPTSWGVASNKLVAKIATEVGKPMGLVVVPPGEEKAFLAPLPVQMLWGVGPKAQQRLAEVGIFTIGDLSGLNEQEIQLRLGDWGMDLAEKAKGIDTSLVHEGRDPKSISHERTYQEDVSDYKKLKHSILQMSEWVGGRLRRAGLVGRTVKIKIRWPDFRTLTRQLSLAQGTDQDREIFEAAMRLFENEWDQGKAVRLLGVGISDLGPPIRQLGLFEDTWMENERLLQAVDEIRRRYGSRALRRAGDLRKDE